MKMQIGESKYKQLVMTLSLISFFMFYGIQVNAQKLPKAIYNTGEAAEDLVDYAQAANWKEVKLKIDVIDHAYNSYRSEAIHYKLSPQLLDFYSMYVEQLHTALKAKNTNQIAFAANQITGIGVDYASHFQHKIPTDVSRLDYLGRELLLEAKDNNSIAVNRRLSDIDETWSVLKPVIIAKHGNKQASEFESLVSKIKSLKGTLNSVGFKHTVNKYSDQIDKLEKLF